MDGAAHREETGVPLPARVARTLRVGAVARLARRVVGGGLRRARHAVDPALRRASWVAPSLRFVLAPTPPGERRILAIWDFQAVPFSIGELLMANVMTLCKRLEHNVDKIDVCFVCDPKRPARDDHAGLVVEQNYREYLSSLTLCMHLNPHLGAFFLFDSYADLERHVAANIERYIIWPSGAAYVSREPAYTLNFKYILDFHRKYGFVPHLENSRSTMRWANRFLREHVLPNHAIVCQLRNNPHISPTRNAHMDTWLQFFNYCGRRYDATFILIGARDEVDQRVRSCPNVLVAKDFGTTLEQDLGLIQAATLYMGVASGPSVVAIFSDVPYVLVNVSWMAEKVAYGAQLPFALPLQRVRWERETATLLIDEFERLWSQIDKAGWRARVESAQDVETKLCLR